MRMITAVRKDLENAKTTTGLEKKLVKLEIRGVYFRKESWKSKTLLLAVYAVTSIF